MPPLGMTCRVSRWFFIPAIVWVCALAPLGSKGIGQEPSSESAPASTVSGDEQIGKQAVGVAGVDFAADVFPILHAHCYKCHGNSKQEGDLRIDQKEILLTEDFVEPGDASNSRLYEVLISEDDDRMPPEDEGHTLAPQEIVTIKSWIDGGAEWSDISALLAAIAPEPIVDQEAAAKPLSPRAEFWLSVWRAFGDLHPATVHFPIALLAIGGLFAVGGLRGSYRCSDFAFYCLWLGSLAAIVSSVLGWSFAWNEGQNEDPFLFDAKAELFWHRWTGVALALFSFLVAVWATIARRRDPQNGTLWKLGLIALAGLTIYVGHAGGELTHRRGYRRIYELFGIQAPANPAAAPKKPVAPANGDS